MESNSKYWKKWQIALLIFAVYNLIVVINIPSAYVASLQSPRPDELVRAIFRLALANNLWAMTTPLILWWGWVFPISKPRLFRNLGLHFLFALCVGAFQHSANSIGTWGLGISSAESFQTTLYNHVLLMRTVTGTLVHYPVIIISQRAYLYFRESQERALLQKQAELTALQAQLHPHFFFNTLNALSALIYRAPKEADKMITQLGDLFRILLKENKEQEVSLKEELAFLESYLKIHQTLMGDRLKVEWKIEPETLDALVPNLILQPLVENSVIHGLSALEEGGRIEVVAERQGGHLRLEVRDNGVGMARKASESKKGIGLGNTQSRLEHLYGDDHEFNVIHPADGGLAVVMNIPITEKVT